MCEILFLFYQKIHLDYIVSLGTVGVTIKVMVVHKEHIIEK